MMKPVIELADLYERLEKEDWIIVDCRFSLLDVNAGKEAYIAAHIPSAQYVHLDDDLCGPLSPGSGRHPLPSEKAMAELFGRLGISDETPVVVYDDETGIAASRLWWMLSYMGHRNASVLNGGLPVWQAEGLPLATGIEMNDPVSFKGQARGESLVYRRDVLSSRLLIDSRAPQRYRGEVEPIDPIAGRIPGAVNRFHKANYNADGRFLPPDQLRRSFEKLLGDIPAADATFYCGSGVTACNNLVALAYAGLGEGRLYAGSWSEWCADAQNPIAHG